MAEAFHCTLAEAERELDERPGVVFEILELRAAANAWHAYRDIDRLDKKGKQKLLRDALVQEVRQLDFDDARKGLGADERSDGGHG